MLSSAILVFAAFWFNRYTAPIVILFFVGWFSWLFYLWYLAVKEDKKNERNKKS